MKCGRIASDKDLEKAPQSRVYIPTARDVHLGEKIIPFRLKAHDPRVMNAYKQSWKEHLANESEDGRRKWEYCQPDMEEDLFLHRFRERPTVQSILDSIPVVDPYSIPQDGVGDEIASIKDAMAEETEALILEKQSHRILIEIINKLKIVECLDSERNPDSLIMSDILATWNKESRTGVSVALCLILSSCLRIAHLPLPFTPDIQTSDVFDIKRFQ